MHCAPLGKAPVSRRCLLGSIVGLLAVPWPPAIAAAPAGWIVRDPTLDRAARRADLCSGASAIGVGLRGEYFGAARFAGPTLLTRIDPVLDFDAGLEWPKDLAARRPASARWHGWVKAPIGGRYRFHLDAADTTLAVASLLQAEGGRAIGPGIDLAAGRYYPIAIDVAALPAPGGYLRLEWTAPHGARYIVPRALLHLPTDTVTKRG